jgi:hypothetical protein
LVPKGLKNKFATHLLRKAFRDYTLDCYPAACSLA